MGLRRREGRLNTTHGIRAHLYSEKCNNKHKHLCLNCAISIFNEVLLYMLR